MKKIALDINQQRTLQIIGGGIAGSFLAVLLGAPLRLLALAAVCAAAYAFHWRVAIIRKPPKKKTPTVEA